MKQMKKNDIAVKKLSTEHIDQYNELLRYAFQVTEKTLLDYGWENDDIRQSKFPVLEHANVLGCFDKNTLVSQFAVYPIEMNIHSMIYKVGFVTSVATYPEYSGLGLMSRLMRRSLVEMRENGQSLALLYPYSIPLYRHRGWEIISDKMTWRISNAQIPNENDVPGYVRRVAEDSNDLMALHTRFARQTHGCLLRNSLAWDEYWRWDVDDITIAIYYSAEDIPLGYMVYLINEDIMHVKEMIYLNKEARKGLFKYIAAHDSMIDEVRGSNYSGESIAFSLPDSDIKETIRPYIMGRIVDLKQFLLPYQFAQGMADISFTFCITDPFLKWNEGTCTVLIQNGKGQFVSKPSRHKVFLSIGTLTAFFLGYKRAPELAELDLIRADEETIRLLDNVIIRKKPYISDYI